MAAEAGGDGRAGIGTRLRAARERKGLTVLQAAEKLHVDPRILEALEGEDFASLGAAVYARGHLRHYAELINEKPAELAELYSGSTRGAPTQPDLTQISRAPPESEATKFSGTAVVVVVTIAVIGTLWWFISTSGQKPQPAEVQESAQTNTLAPAPTRASAPAANATRAPTTAAAGANLTHAVPAAASATSETRGPPATTLTAGVTHAASVAAPPSSATAAGGTPTASSEPPLARAAPRPKVAELTLKFSSDSWAEVYDATGQRLFYDVGAASSAHTVKGPAPLRIVLGNASGVTLEYNGRPTLIPSGVLPDGSVHFVINAHGHAVPATDGD